MEDIRDIKGPYSLPFEINWWMWLLGVLILLGIGTLLYFVFRKKRAEAMTKPSKIIPPEEVALAALEALIQKGYPASAQFKEYFFELSMILRQYLESRFQIPVTEKTTEEFLVEMAESQNLKDAQKKTLQQFLMQSDLIKFAKQETSVKECDESEKIVRKMIQETTRNQLPETNNK